MQQKHGGRGMLDEHPKKVKERQWTLLLVARLLWSVWTRAEEYYQRRANGSACGAVLKVRASHPDIIGYVRGVERAT